MLLQLSWLQDQATAQTVSGCLRNVGFVVDKVALGQVFSEHFSFPCQFSFHQILHTHLSSGAGTVGQIVADVASWQSLTPFHEKKNTTMAALVIMVIICYVFQ
jgi:hypothetical protein